jgi:hypothetical protein
MEFTTIPRKNTAGQAVTIPRDRRTRRKTKKTKEKRKERREQRADEQGIR